MEVQGSGVEDNDDIRSDVSLVDSLDDPGSPKRIKSPSPVPPITQLSPVESLKDLSQLTPTIDDSTAPTTKTPREKGQSFFVPISDEYDIMDEQLGVSESMPEKLRERLQRRQLELEERKEMEFHKQFANLNKENLYGRNKKSSIIVLAEPDALTPAQTNTIQQPIMKKNGIKNKNSNPKAGLGMLESYTIDSRGQMNFESNGSRGTAAIKILPKVKNGVANGATPAVKKLAKNENNEVIKVGRSEKQTDKNSKSSKDVQRMTFSSNQSELTPDMEGGPRRMYQKTEIHDNGKQIEILEIVECMDSSPDLSRSYRSSNTRSGEQLLPGKKSMIPIPVSISAKTPIRIKPNSTGGKREKIDRVIADLLIGAINDPDSSVIELIQSPKDSKKATKSKQKQITKRGAPPNVRYSQNFDVIPEESRSSMSSNDESKSQKSKKMQIIKAKNSERFVSMGNTDPPRSMATLPSEIEKSRPKKSSPPHAFDIMNNNPSKSPTFIKISPTITVDESQTSIRTRSQESPKISPWASPTYTISSPKRFVRNHDGVEHVPNPRGWRGFYDHHDDNPFEFSPSEGTRV